MLKNRRYLVTLYYRKYLFFTKKVKYVIRATNLIEAHLKNEFYLRTNMIPFGSNYCRTNIKEL